MKYVKQWHRISDVCEGTDAVKQKRETYLPRPTGMEKVDYDAYLDRAEFYNPTGRTLDGLHGMVFRKDPIIEVPEFLKQYLNNVDGKGTTFKQFCSNVSYETLKHGWGAILIDAPQADEIISQKDAEELGIQPYMTYISAFDFNDWHYGEKGRSRNLSKAVLHEEYEEESATDEFVFQTKEKYRMLKLDENGDYVQIVKSSNNEVLEYNVPKKLGSPLNHIPLYPVPSDNPEKPMLIDLADLNIAWYRKSADLENGGHWTGVPTPYVLGYQPEMQYDEEGNEIGRDKLYIGGSEMLCFPQGTTGIGYLEYHGSGLSQLQNMMQNDEERMAILGARIISAEKKGVESAESARIHRSGENSVLATFANNMSTVLKKVLIEYLEWCGNVTLNDEDVTVSLNTDYEVSKMNSSELASLVSAWQSGGISKRVMFNNMKEGELVPSEMTFEEMEDEIDSEKEKTGNLNNGEEE